MRLRGSWVLVLAMGCAEHFPLPMTAAQLDAYDSGAALVAYLGQAQASDAVCDVHGKGPHISGLDADGKAALVDSIVDGKVDPELWRHCATTLLRSLPQPDRALLVDAVGRGYRKLIRRSDFETSPAAQARMSAMQRFYVDRKHGLDGNPLVDDKLFAELRLAIGQHRLGEVATRFGQELLEAVDLEHGMWLGQPVTVAVLDSLSASHDEQALQRFSRRLSSAELRDEARRRVIRLHIAASPFAEVRANAATVESTLMAHGNNPLSLPVHPPRRAWFDPSHMPMRGVLVRQQTWQQTATLLGYRGDQPGVSVMPELALRGALLVEVDGISRPVTLCAPKQDLDPSPCVNATDVKVENPVAYLDHGGVFHFVEHLTMADALMLGQMHDKFVLPVSVGGQRLCSFEWRLYYERPADFVVVGGTGGNGPALQITADHRDPLRYVFTVAFEGFRYLAVVEKPDIGSYAIESQGGQGAVGSSGSTGFSGSSGGTCENGGAGGPGGPGGSGGPAGNGGDVHVRVLCTPATCPEAVEVLRHTMTSAGGSGGPGGNGGDGGPGGYGGSSRSPVTHTDSDGNTITDDPGCSAGSTGPSGPSGSNGPSGPNGQPGRVDLLYGD